MEHGSNTDFQRPKPYPCFIRGSFPHPNLHAARHTKKRTCCIANDSNDEQVNPQITQIGADFRMIRNSNLWKSAKSVDVVFSVESILKFEFMPTDGVAIPQMKD